ncbi:hypothetical protein C7M84_023871 [Penaeus vannamei]|uniref:Ig-like domain-containing protein n=1 Tax=Penaeus vannamei TaxID=6689 RepID=A0A3R7Q0Q3_PENVA|nr:hypothetical protein C7M84_023871 [Penaeus vannamei]
MGVRDKKGLAVPLLFVLVRLVLAQAARVSDYGVSTKLHIVNGTESIVREGESNFVFCYAGVRNLRGRAPYTVVWTDPWGRPLLPLPGISLNARLFSVRENELRPNAYMVFQMFDEDLEGVYTCNLVFKNRLVSLRRIRLKMFRPSYRVVTLAPCLAVQEGGSALLPAPVVGSPPAPPVWSKAGGSLDPSEAQVVQAGLVLHAVQEPGVYRVQVPLGGGLVHQQETVVAVVRIDGRKDFPSDATSAATAGPCPPWDATKPTERSDSVSVANDVIADIQMHS